MVGNLSLIADFATIFERFSPFAAKSIPASLFQAPHIKGVFSTERIYCSSCNAVEAAIGAMSSSGIPRRLCITCSAKSDRFSLSMPMPPIGNSIENASPFSLTDPLKRFVKILPHSFGQRHHLDLAALEKQFWTGFDFRLRFFPIRPPKPFAERPALIESRIAFLADPYLNPIYCFAGRIAPLGYCCHLHHSKN